MKQKTDFQTFISYFKPHRRLFFLDLACALMISLIDLAFPFVSRWCMYTLLPNSIYKTFWMVMIIFLFAYLVRSFFTYIICYYGHTFGILVEADMRKDLFEHMQSLSYGYFDNNRIGQLMSRLTTDLFDITELAHHGPEDLFISTVTIIGSIIIMFTIEWRLALVIAIMIPVFILVVWKSRHSMSEASIRVKQKVAVINTDIESGLTGMKTAKAFANETIEQQKFNTSNDTYKTSKKQFHKAMGRFNAIMEFFMCTLSLIVIAVGGALIMQGKMDTIDLITFSLYVSTFVNPVRKLSNFAELFANGTAGLHRFVELLNTKPQLEDRPDAKELTNVSGQIDINHVSFAYEEDRNILTDIDLHIHPGETLALVGSSGGGKTTLSQLIPRFYDVTKGAILVDGHDVRDVTQTSLHNNIGVVSQDVFLFADSIAENIRYGKPEATDEEVVNAAMAANAHEFIMSLPEGYHTDIGQRGVKLSGGQKQRLSIARVFLKNPPVLIFDEATSALDNESEKIVQHSLEMLAKDRTTFVIAHRLSTIRNAQRILVLTEDGIAEEGTHKSLLAQGGIYAGLYNMQF